MKVIRTIQEMREVSSRCKQKNIQLGCVPTMGYLHEGHLSLVRGARQRSDEVVVTIFVNPAQFGPNEDFEQYPRDEERDLGLLAKEGVDWVFIPVYHDIYPEGFSTYIEPPRAAENWCGASRPVHFKGVCTIIAILFSIIQPSHAFFGQKDAQQCAVIRSLVRDLQIPVSIEVMPTIRETDGLAMSSRNQYLSLRERKDALLLQRVLQSGKQQFENGETDSITLINDGIEKIEKNSNVTLDYLAIVEEKYFQAVDLVKKGHLYIGAIYVGKTRLIDNIIF